MPAPGAAPLGLVALALAVAACGAASSDGRDSAAAHGDAMAAPLQDSVPVTADPSQPADSLRLRLDAPTQARLGETVSFTLRAENTGTRPLELYLRGRTIAFDVVVTRAPGDTVWQRLADEIIPAIVQLRTLAPGEVLELRVEWDQRTNAGARVDAGDYVATGVLLTDAPTPLRTPPVPLRIVPR